MSKPLVGDRLGSFRLLQLLGEGGAGAVYRAEHTFLKRQVAIKVLHPELSYRPGMVARFFQEALAVNRARHPNIIDITDVVEGEDFPPFIVMELLTGLDLADFIDEKAPIEPDIMVSIATQICDALSLVHSLDIIHRDLKPENIFLAHGGLDGFTVKLLDFGIAKFTDPQGKRRRTWSGSILGTPAYMPLEQLHGLNVDARTDIYAVGVVMYEMLCARLPFEIDTVDDLLDSQALGEPPPPSERTEQSLPWTIPAALDQVVVKCLANDPARRYQNVDELKAALLDARDSQPAPTAEGGLALPSLKGSDLTQALTAAAELGAPTARDRRKATTAPDLARGAKIHRRWIWTGVGAVAVILMLLAYLKFREDAPPRPARSARSLNPPGAVRPSMIPQGARRVPVSTVPPGASIQRADNGQRLGRTPAHIVLSPGQSHALVLRLAGYHDHLLELKYSNPDPERITLRRSVAPVAPPDGGVTRQSMAPLPVPHRRPPMRAASMSGMLNVTDQGILDPFRK
ncbi:MAG: serine/threonine-protein kinase [bacterium]